MGIGFTGFGGLGGTDVRGGLYFVINSSLSQIKFVPVCKLPDDVLSEYLYFYGELVFFLRLGWVSWSL